jgi:hypothetical protein
LSKNNHKNVTIKRHNFTKSERECVKGIIHNLSFQRLTDQEIVQWLLDEKEIDIDRSTVSKMRNQVETKAEKWYIELKKSTYKFVAVYKERIDSLFSYQKKLHEIIDSTKKPEVQLRAISELHSIEMSIFSLWKQLPDLDIVDSPQQEESLNKDKSPYINIDTVMPEYRDKIFPIAICRCEGTQQHYACYNCLRAFCRPESDDTRNNGSVRCPLCKTVVYSPPDAGWV